VVRDRGHHGAGAEEQGELEGERALVVQGLLVPAADDESSDDTDRVIDTDLAGPAQRGAGAGAKRDARQAVASVAPVSSSA
jgi:hypothetical protein